MRAQVWKPRGSRPPVLGFCQLPLRSERTWSWAPRVLAFGVAMGSQQRVFHEETLENGPGAFPLLLNRPEFVGSP